MASYIQGEKVKWNDLNLDERIDWLFRQLKRINQMIGRLQDTNYNLTRHEHDSAGLPVTKTYFPPESSYGSATISPQNNLKEDEVIF